MAKLRVLCFHGFHSDGDGTRDASLPLAERIGKEVGRSVELVCPTAPNNATSDDHPRYNVLLFIFRILWKLGAYIILCECEL